jgi:hypothetical protein
MARIPKGNFTIDKLEFELDNFINTSKYFGSISEDVRKLVHKVFFVHAILEGQLRMRLMYKLFEEQMSALRGEEYCMTDTVCELTKKLTYTQMLIMVRGFKDGAPCGTLEKINSIRNDFGHPVSRGWKAKSSSKASQVEVLQLLIVGLNAMEEYMEKVRTESRI